MHMCIYIYMYIQWPFQDPELAVPTIQKAYVLGLCEGIYLQNMVKIWYSTVPPIKRILKFPLNLPLVI